MKLLIKCIACCGISIILFGCNKIPEKEIQNNNIYNNSTTKDITENKSSSWWMNADAYTFDALSSEYRYGTVPNPIEYDEKQVEFVVELSKCISDDISKYINCICYVMLDNQIIESSIDDNNEAMLIHNINIKQDDNNKITIKFEPKGVSTELIKKINIVVIPFYNKPNTDIDENDVMSLSYNIVSIKNNISAKEKLKCTNAISAIETNSILGNGSKLVGEGPVRDSLVYSDDGKLYYVYSGSENNVQTMLFCDGQPYSGFDDCDTLIISENASYTIKQIDLSKLTSGSHILFAISSSNEAQYTKFLKTSNLEVDIK